MLVIKESFAHYNIIVILYQLITYLYHIQKIQHLGNSVELSVFCNLTDFVK